MKIIGLISGGKDSILGILTCLAHGHEVIGLAQLVPL